MRFSLSNQTLSATNAANAQSTQKPASDNVWSALQSSNYTCSLETQICCFDKATFGNSFSVLTYPSPQGVQGPICLNIGYGPMDDGPICLASAANHTLVSLTRIT